MNPQTPDSETTQKIREMQILEQNLHNVLMQKQAMQFELNETINALEEVKKTSEDIYKMAGQILIKADKALTISELEEKKKILELRTSAIEKQESLFESKAQELRKETEKLLSKTPQNKD